MLHKHIYFFIAIIYVIVVSALPTGAAEKRGETLEMHHPKGWQFTMPKGDAIKGREVSKHSAATCAMKFVGRNFPPPHHPEALWVRN
jgi:hypothetical protein